MVKCRISLWIGVDEGGCSKNSAESREPDDDDNLPDDAYRVDEDEFLIRLDGSILRLRRLYSFLRPIFLPTNA